MRAPRGIASTAALLLALACAREEPPRLVEAGRNRLTQALPWYDAALELQAALLGDQPENAEALAAHVQAWRSKALLLAQQKRHDEAHEASKKGEAFG